jgi:hypothetical protein
MKKILISLLFAVVLSSCATTSRISSPRYFPLSKIQKIYYLSDLQCRAISQFAQNGGLGKNSYWNPLTDQREYNPDFNFQKFRVDE